ncbi:MAG: hypothetical protein JWN94_556 [Betaproteobacteria bacterium]|nr:hypothetical protein [Betaproteobacteria bacterium]
MTAANTTQRPRLGFIGMGGMGSRMAGRLLAAGYDLTVYNRSRERTQSLAERGAKVAASPAELAEGVEIVLSSLADDAAVETVMMAPHGAIFAARAGTIFVDMSTVSPALSRRLHAAGRRNWVFVLDAPVSGTTSVAEQGELSIFVGGERAVYERCKPIFEAISKASLHMGPAGSGVMTKLCANTMLGLGMQALAEAVTLGTRGGLQRDGLLDALAGTAVVSPSQKSKLENVRNGVYPPAFPLQLMAKDFRLIQSAAADLAMAMPGTAAAAQVAANEADRQSALGHDEDFSSVVRAVEQMATA